MWSFHGSRAEHQAPSAVDARHGHGGHLLLYSNSQILLGNPPATPRYYEGNQKLINCLTTAVKIFMFLGIRGEAVNQVRCACHPVTLLTVTSSDPNPALFAGIDTRPAVRPFSIFFYRFACDELCQGQVRYIDALLEFFGCFASMLKRVS